MLAAWRGRGVKEGWKRGIVAAMEVYSRSRNELGGGLLFLVTGTSQNFAETGEEDKKWRSWVLTLVNYKYPQVKLYSS